MANLGIGNQKLLAGRIVKVSWVALGCGVMLLIASIVWPIDVNANDSVLVAVRRVKPLPTGKKDLDPLLRRMAGVRLIRPAQVQAAVKDSGAAQRLLEKLKLQGVVQLGEDNVAYVQIHKQGVVSVRVGEKILDFTVEEIKSGKVKLSLEGVVVYLGH